jgi:hypothetical protein
VFNFPFFKKLPKPESPVPREFEGAITPDFAKKWVRDWAYSPMPYYPEQDWEIIISRPEIAEDLFNIIESQTTPKDVHLLSILYLTVGDMARSMAPVDPQSPIFQTIQRGLTSNDARLKRWAERSHDIFDFRSYVIYEDWCSGGFARQEKPSHFGENLLLIEDNPKKIRTNKNSPLRAKYPGWASWKKLELDSCLGFLSDCESLSYAPLGFSGLRRENKHISHRFDLLGYATLPPSRTWHDFVHHSNRELKEKIEGFVSNLPEDAKRYGYTLNSGVKFTFEFTVFSKPDEEVSCYD